MRKSLISLLVVAFLVAEPVAVIAQLPPVRDADAGDQAFFRRAVPLLLGRMAKGVDEIEVLSDLSAIVGREKTLRAIMARPEFLENWTAMLMDDLEVQRMYVPNVSIAMRSCFGDPRRPGLPLPDLAGHVSRGLPSAPAPGGAFNMTDLVYSAIVLDNLSPIYRALPLPTREQIGDFMQRESTASNTFSRLSLSRDPPCLTCHNSEYSSSGITGASSGWPRTHPIPFNFEGAVFGRHYTSPAMVAAKTAPLFRDDQFPVASAPGPWGLADCGTYLLDTSGLQTRPTEFAGTSNGRMGLAQVAEVFKSGNDAITRDGLQSTPQPYYSAQEVPGDQAFAYLTAVTVVENIWNKVMGADLTIAHYYPRNTDQRDVLQTLTDDFVHSNWSLKHLLTQIMLSPYFNRLAPAESNGSTAYDMQMIFDPWVADDPRDNVPASPSENFNSQGDVVHRLAPWVLLNAVSSALAWPKASRFGNVPFPDDSLVRASGQYISYSEQGDDDVNFQGLLVWENRLAPCQKPPGVGTDWIDRLIAAIGNFDAENASSPATLRDVIITMKDWIINETTIGMSTPIGAPKSEQDGLSVFFGAQPLNVAAASIPQLESKLRAYCGVLLKTPQFFLAGLSSRASGPPPRLRVCNDSECDYLQMCQALAMNVPVSGGYVTCDGTTRSVSFWRFLSKNPLVDVCVLSPWDCGFVSPDLAPYCLRHPQNCIDELTAPQLPKPDCVSWDCPWPPFSTPEKLPLAIINLDSGVVGVAKSVRRRSLAKNEFAPLSPGDVLSVGDTLELTASSELLVKSRLGELSYPARIEESSLSVNSGDIGLRYRIALENGDVPSLAEILAGSPTLANLRSEEGETALMKAAKKGDVESLVRIIKVGANLALQSHQGLTAADFALLTGQEAVLDALRKAGLEPQDKGTIRQKSTTESGPTPSYVIVGGDRLFFSSLKSATEEDGEAQVKNDAESKTQTFSIDDLPEELQQRGSGHNGLAGSMPATFEEAKKQVDEYRHSPGFFASHPDLEKQ